MNYKKSIKNIEPYKPGLSEDDIKELYNLEKVVKLASNENPYGSAVDIKDVYENINATERYPDNYCKILRKKLAIKYNVNEENLILGNGSVEIIQMIARALIEPEDEVITCTPTFQSCFLETYIEQGKVITIPVTESYKFDLNGMISEITSRTKIIYIVNPNNPTGTIVTNSELEEFLKRVPDDIVVVLDEAYAEYVTDKDYPNSIELLEKYSNICILRTFSKAYGLASMRIGYGISSKEIIRELEKVRLPFNVSTLAQKAACMALEREEFLNKCINNNKLVKEMVYKILDENKIRYIKSEANFIMLDVNKDSETISKKLLETGFIVRPVNMPNMNTFIRVTIGTESEMTEFIEALNKILKEM